MLCHGTRLPTRVVPTVYGTIAVVKPICTTAAFFWFLDGLLMSAGNDRPHYNTCSSLAVLMVLLQVKACKIGCQCCASALKYAEAEHLRGLSSAGEMAL